MDDRGANPGAGSGQMDQRVTRMVRRMAGARAPPRVAARQHVPREVHSRSASSARRVARLSRHVAGSDSVPTVELPAQRVPVLAQCEVLVVGGGPAGLSAALGARRAGADVILMERFGCFGGVITTVGMEKDPSLAPTYSTNSQEPVTLAPAREAAVQALIADLRKR